MSAYKVIKTQIKNGESLKKALSEMGVVFECSQQMHTNTTTLNTSWGSRYGGSNQQVDIAIQKISAKKTGFGNFDGLGFRWNGSSYDLVQDHYDENDSNVSSKLNELKQRYGVHEVRRQARARGYTTQETRRNDGTIEIKLVAR